MTTDFGFDAGTNARLSRALEAVPKMDFSQVQPGADAELGLPQSMPQEPQQPQQPTFEDMLAAMEAQKGSPLTGAEIRQLGETFLTQVGEPAFRRDARTAAEADANVTAFRSAVDQRAASAPGTPEDAEFRPVRDFLAQTAGGVAKIPGNVAIAADYLGRSISGGAQALASPIDALIEGEMPSLDRANQAFERGFGTQGVLADMGLSTNQAIGGIADSLTSERTMQAAQGLGEQLQDESQDGWDTLRYLWDNKSAMIKPAGETVGGLAAGLLGRVAPIAQGMRGMDATTRGATAAAMVGVPFAGGGTGEAEQQRANMPLDQLGQSPEVRSYIEEQQALGLPDDQIAAQLAARGAPIELAGQLVANVGLPAFNPLRLESIAANQLQAIPGRMNSGVARAGATAGTQIAEEAAAGVAEAVGSNLAKRAVTGADIPVFEGADRQAALGGALGGIVGGTLGLAGTPPAGPAAAPAGDATPTGGTPAAPTGGTPAAAQAGTATPTMNPMQEPAGPGVENLQDATNRLDNRLAVLTRQGSANATRLASEAVSGQQVVAEAVAVAGMDSQWATMTGEQRADVVEAVATKLNDVAKKDIAETLQAVREQLVAPPAPTAAPVEGQPVTAADVTATPAAEGQTQAPPAVTLTPDGTVVPAATTPAPTATPAVADTPAAAATETPPRGLRGNRGATPAQVPTPTPLEPAPAAAPQPATQTPTAPDFRLPQNLRGASPRYGGFGKNLELDFASDLDKALYIIAGSKSLSKGDKGYVDAVVEATGLSRTEARARGQEIRALIKERAQSAERGSTLSIPTTFTVEGLRPKTDAPAPAPTDAGANAQAAIAVVADTAPETDGAGKVDPEPAAVELAEQIGQAVEAEQTALREAETLESSESIAQRLFGEDLTPQDLADVANAIDQSREGSQDALNDIIRTLREDGVLDAEQAANLRREAREIKREGEREAAADKAALDELASETVADESTRVDQAADPVAMVQMQEGPIKWQDHANVAALVDYVLSSNSPNKAGDLLRGLARLPGVRPEQRWLAKKLAPLMDRLNVKLTQADPNRPTWGGAYLPYSNTMWFRQKTPTVLLHESLHAVTSNVLDWKGSRVSPTVRRVQQRFERIREATLAYMLENPNRVRALQADMGINPMSDQGPVGNSKELLSYGMTDKEFQAFLNEIDAPRGTQGSSVWDAFKNNIASLFGRSPQPAQRSMLDELIEATGELVDMAELQPSIVDFANMTARAQLLSSSNLTLADPVQIQQIVDTLREKISNVNLQQFNEWVANAQYGMELAGQDVSRQGGNVTPENSPYYAARKLTSDIAENTIWDMQQYITPVEDWVVKNYTRFNENIDTFRDKLNTFMEAYHVLNERNPSMWAEQVPLNAGMDIIRAEILEAMKSGSIAPEQGYAQIRALASQHASQTLDEWTKSSPNAMDNADLRKTLAALNADGYNTQNLTEFNDLLTGIRNRSRERMIESGIVSATDPWVDARGWQWYVPLKGNNKASDAMRLYDFGGRTLGGKNLKTAEGRDEFAQNVVEQLAVDMTTASRASAEGNYANTLLEFVTDPSNEGILGATIAVARGTPKSGYVITDANGKERQAQELPNIKKHNGFIAHQGDTHFIVELPETGAGGNLLRGIKGLDAVVTPGRLIQSKSKGVRGVGQTLKGVGKVTNFLSRAYTTFSPEWQFFVGFARDLNYIPTMVAIEAFDNPMQAAPFLAAYGKEVASNIFTLGNLKNTMDLMTGSRKELADYAAQNPNSYISWLNKYRQAGGSTEFAQGLNQESARSLIFGKAKDADGITAIPRMGYTKFANATSTWAALLENRGRVAAFKALVDGGMTETQAAAIVKGSLDYGQSGEYGRLINSWKAFFRIGATSVDAMRRVFTKQTGPDAGQWDLPKISKFVPAIAAIGAAQYMLMRGLLGDDEDGTPKMDKYSAQTITQRMLIPGPGDDTYGYAISLGMPQMLLGLGTLGAAVTAGHIGIDEAADAYYETVLRNSPLQPAGTDQQDSSPQSFAAGWALSILPTAVMAPVESQFNVNAFGSTIRPQWVDNDRDASSQAKPSTPPMWTEIAEGLNQLTDGGVDLHPETIRHYAQSYLGQNVGALSRALAIKTDREAGLTVNTPARLTRTEVRDDQFYWSNELRQTEDQLRADARRKDRLERRDQPVPITVEVNVRLLDDLRKAGRAHRQEITAIRMSDATPEGKALARRRADSQLREAVLRIRERIQD